MAEDLTHTRWGWRRTLAALSYREYRFMWTTNISAGAANL